MLKHIQTISFLKKITWLFSLCAIAMTLSLGFQNCSPHLKLANLDSSSTSAALCQNPINGQCVPTEVTHKMLVGTDSKYNVFSRSCVSCHDSSNSSGGLNLQNASQASAKSALILSRMKGDNLNLTSMPPAGSLTDIYALALVEKWVALGAPADLISSRDAVKPAQYFTCQPNTQSTVQLKRLTKKQVENTLIANFGVTVFESVRPTFDALRSDTLQKDVAEFQNLISVDQMSDYQNLAEQLALYYRANLDRAANFAGNCIRTWPASAACRAQVVSSLGLKLFRRPLLATEQTRIEALVFSAADDGALAVANLVYYFLISPDFLIHFEVGDLAQQETLAAGNIVQLTSYEVASRVSYFLLDGPPDTALLEAARNNQLSTAAQVESHLDRMLTSPQARAKLRDFYRYWLRPRSYDVDRYNADFLTGISNLTQLNSGLQTEMYEYLDYITWTNKGTYRDLLTSPISFARTAPTSAFYKHSPAPVNGFTNMGAGRKGILMRAPVLANPTTDSNIIYRGVKMQTRFLCDVPGLPSGVSLDNPALSTDEVRVQFSNRQRIAQLTGGGSCIGCHSKINPYGFLFENFDSLGRSQTQENSYSDFSKNLLATHAIDTQVEEVFVENDLAPALMNSEALVDSLVVYNKAPACFVRQALRYYHLRRENLALDGCLLSESFVALKGVNGDYANTSLLAAIKKLVINQTLFSRRIQ